MKRTRFTKEQATGVLEKAEASANVADLARRHGVTEATIKNWMSRYGGLAVSDARRQRELDSEKTKLKRLLADANQGSAEGSFGRKYLTSAAKREAIALLYACGGMNERQACRVIDADSKSVRKHFTRDNDATLRENLRELANQTSAVRLSPFANPAAPG